MPAVAPDSPACSSPVLPAGAVLLAARRHDPGLRLCGRAALCRLRDDPGLAEITWDDITEYAPAVVTAVTMPLTYSIATGIGLGFITYALAKVLAGRLAEAKPAVLIWRSCSRSSSPSPGSGPAGAHHRAGDQSTRHRVDLHEAAWIGGEPHHLHGGGGRLRSRKHSPQAWLSASWSVRSVTKRSAVTTSAKVAPAASRPRLRFSSAARPVPPCRAAQVELLGTVRMMMIDRRRGDAGEIDGGAALTLIAGAYGIHMSGASGQCTCSIVSPSTPPSMIAERTCSLHGFASTRLIARKSRQAGASARRAQR